MTIKTNVYLYLFSLLFVNQNWDDNQGLKRVRLNEFGNPHNENNPVVRIVFLSRLAD